MADNRYNFCKLCEIVKNIPDDIGEYADRLYRLLDEDEQADSELIGSRLNVCNACEKNVKKLCKVAALSKKEMVKKFKKL